MDTHDRRLEMTDRREPLTHRRRWMLVERSVLPLDRTTDAGIRQRGVALGDESLHAHRLARRQQVVRALDAQPVGQRELAIDVSHVDRRRYRGELVHDHVGLRLAHDPLDGVGIQRVGHHRLSAETEQLVALGFRARHPDHIVSIGDQHRNKLLAERTRGAGDEDVHVRSLLIRAITVTRRPEPRGPG